MAARAAAAGVAAAAAGLTVLSCCTYEAASDNGKPQAPAAGDEEQRAPQQGMTGVTGAAALPLGSPPAQLPQPPPPARAPQQPPQQPAPELAGQPPSLLGTLGLEGREGVTDAEIRRAYRKLALKYHPDRLGKLGSEAEIAAATERFAEIQSAYEILTGEDQSIVEAGGGRVPPQQEAVGTDNSDAEEEEEEEEEEAVLAVTAGERVEQLTAEILHVRRHGKKLTFCRMRVAEAELPLTADGGQQAKVAPVDLFFSDESFGHERSPTPFPAAKRSIGVGDTVTLDGVWQWGSGACAGDKSKPRLCVEAWSRKGIATATVETAVQRCDFAKKKRLSGASLYRDRSVYQDRLGTNTGKIQKKRGVFVCRIQRVGMRRTGKAAMAGWVACPICAQQHTRRGKRYNRGGGLRQHLDRTHVEQRDAFVDAARRAPQPPSSAQTSAAAAAADICADPSAAAASATATAIEAWHSAMTAEAEALGVQSRRSAGSAGTRHSKGADRLRGMSYVGSELALSEVRKRHFLSTFVICKNVIILPRQARDERRESTQKTSTVFLQEPGSLGEKLKHPALIAARCALRCRFLVDEQTRRRSFGQDRLGTNARTFAKTGSGQM